MWLFVSGSENGMSEELLSGGILMLYISSCACTDWIIRLKAIRNTRGERVSPGNTPFFTEKEGGCQILVTTCAESEEYI